MAEPRPGQTTFLIIVSPLPGKYELGKTEVAPAALATGITQAVDSPPGFCQVGGASSLANGETDIAVGTDGRSNTLNDWQNLAQRTKA